MISENFLFSNRVDEKPPKPNPPTPLPEGENPVISLPSTLPSNQSSLGLIPILTIPQKTAQFPSMSQLPKPKLIPKIDPLKSLKQKLQEARELQISLIDQGVKKIVETDLAEEFFPS
jgi:hypothetical protein